MIFKLVRDCNPLLAHNFGKFYVGDLLMGQTLEDKDRRLEDGGEKIPGETAIPRGTYEIKLTWSKRFNRRMSEIIDVPGFSAVRIHGGNTEVDTRGCPMLGLRRDEEAGTLHGCKGVNDQLIRLLEAARSRGERSWITVS